MAKRELSSTLRNLKFMQRAAQKEEDKPKGEEKPKQDDSFGASAAPTKRCIVIMEGDPHPGALKGRMSFQSFNPSVDKLHEEAAIIRQMQASNINYQNGSSDREDGTSVIRSEDSNVASPGNDSDMDLKRKQPGMEMETPSPYKSQKIAGGDGSGQSSSQNNAQGSYKQQKREKLDWNVLRPPKAQTKRS